MRLVLRRLLFVLLPLLGCAGWFTYSLAQDAGPPAKESGDGEMAEDELPKTEVEWRKRLTSAEFKVLRKKGTERAFSGKYWKNHDPGQYACAGCGQKLFSSEAKFESGTGWPSFFQPVDKENVKMAYDDTGAYRRVEVLCRRCGGHLGHVFDDGPAPTGLRYCINSICLKFEPAEKANADKSGR